MALIVQKYGGTSVGSIERIEAVADRVIGSRARGDQVIVVLSAMSGETNRLIGLAQQIQEVPDPRELDVLVATGEQVTIALLCMALIERGCPARSYTGSQVRILTDNAHNKARIREIDDAALHADLNAGRVVVVAGFQGVDERGNITTLGRGGSDTTAVALAAALKAQECQIFTDVDGVYTTDPRVVDEARRLESITFEEMLEMASFVDGPGTLITQEDPEPMENPAIAGIAFTRDEAKLTIIGVPDTPGVAYRILGPVGEANIEVDVIVQNVGQDGTTDLTFTVHRNDMAKARAMLDRVAAELGAREVRTDDKICKVSLVGVGMRSHAGIASKMFKVLVENNINIQMITTSEIKVSVVIDQKFVELAVRALHSAFGLEQGR